MNAAALASQPADHLLSELETLHPAGFAWALTCCGGRRDEAEEVLQTSYAKYLSGAARPGGRSTFKTWWFGLVRLTALEHRRRQWLRWFRFAPLEEAADRPSDEPSPDQSAAQAELVAEVTQALRSLSIRQQEVLSLAFVHGLSLDEAAQVLGLNPGSVRRHYERGKQRLRVLLHRHLPASTVP